MNIKKKPVWQEPLDKLTPHPEEMNSQAEIKAIDAMVDMRNREMAVSKDAREWEKDRKKELEANKKYYFKDIEAKKPKDTLLTMIDDVKNGGSYQTSVHPLEGYILCKLEKVDKQLASGVYLPEDTNETPNTARVIEVGTGYWVFNDHFREPMVKPGQLVIFRKMAGMNIEVKKERLYMLHFDDVIATISEEVD